jgi:hypothetical protein
MCSVWEFSDTALERDGCTACIADCYRDSNMMLHFAVSLGDAVDHLKKGQVLSALKMLADERNLSSLGAVAENAQVLSKLAKRDSHLPIDPTATTEAAVIVPASTMEPPATTMRPDHDNALGFGRWRHRQQTAQKCGYKD